MYELTIKSHFAAAHNLREYQGNCERLHGHNWQVDITLVANELNELGMAMDFRTVKATLKPIMDELDHAYLNEVPFFQSANPTTENIARYIYSMLQRELPEGIQVARVTAWESPDCAATYRED